MQVTCTTTNAHGTQHTITHTGARGGEAQRCRAPSGQVQTRGAKKNWAKYRGFIGFFFPRYKSLSDFSQDTRGLSDFTLTLRGFIIISDKPRYLGKNPINPGILEKIR